MKETIKQIKDLATATDNLYLLHLVKKLKKQIKRQNKEAKILVSLYNETNKLEQNKEATKQNI
jgi:hypothetical protein